jgi:hypothetical protein
MTCQWSERFASGDGSPRSRSPDSTPLSVIPIVLLHDSYARVHELPPSARPLALRAVDERQDLIHHCRSVAWTVDDVGCSLAAATARGRARCGELRAPVSPLRTLVGAASIARSCQRRDPPSARTSLVRGTSDSRRRRASPRRTAVATMLGARRRPEEALA